MTLLPARYIWMSMSRCCWKRLVWSGSRCG